MKKIYGRLLEYENNIYSVNHTRDFKGIQLNFKDDIEKCFDFAYQMAFGEGEHRAKRSNGKKVRKPGEIFINTFQGKLSEFAVYRYLNKSGIKVSEPDLDVFKLGIWDCFDLEYKGKYIAIKSTKSYGNLLLLETKDWDDQGRYIPNQNKGIDEYDMFVLVRIAPNGEELMKQHRYLYSLSVDKSDLQKILLNLKWEYDIAGVITRADLKRLIEVKYVLPQGALLNGETRMDAENYYVQSGDMRSPEEMVNRMRSYEEYAVKRWR